MSKAGRPKKGSAGLPAWFDIQKYKPARGFGAMGWYEQLVFRMRILETCEILLKKGNTDFSPLKKAMGLLQDDPIITEQRVIDITTFVAEKKIPTNHPLFGKGSIITGHFDVDPVIGLTVRPLGGSALTPLTIGDFYDIENPDEQEGDETSVAAFDSEGKLNLNEPALLWHAQPLVAVDTTINDEIILREMGEWLLELRKTEKIPPLAFTKNSDFSKWYNSGVLPYLDLLLWEKMGHAFKWAAFISELSQILDKPIGSESAAMKAAQSFSRKLLNEQTLRTLEAQATRERPRGTKKSGKLFVR